MIAIPAYAPRAAAKILVTLVCVLLAVISARAQGKLKAHYTISMTGVTIGEIVWLVEIGDTLYTTSATGKASGVLSMLVNGEGSVASPSANVSCNLIVPSSSVMVDVYDDGLRRSAAILPCAATEPSPFTNMLSTPLALPVAEVV